MNRTIAGPVFAALLFAGRAAGAPPAPASPWDVAARLEARLAAGDGMMQPDADAQFVQHAGTIDLSGDAWPAEFLAREGETICVAVSPFTGHYEFFDESGEVFWTVVPVLPTTENWVASFRHAEPGAFPDDELYASWRLVDMWTLSRAESAKFVSHAENAETLVTRRSSLVARGAASPATNLCFTAIACTETNFCFTAAWPANEPLPESVLDLYGSSNLSARTWTLLSSHPAATPPVSFAVDPAALPWHVAPTQHVHGVSCVSLTNVVLSPLDGTTVYTNVFWSCSTNRAPDEAGFFRLGTRHETDGDGLPDAFELLVSATDPATADTDGDGVPDGQTAAQWLSHPLWAENGDGANLVVSLYEPITNGAAALLFDDLCIPLSSNAGPWSLCIPTNTVVTCKLVAAPGTVVMLWYGPPEAAAQTRSAAPDWTVPPFVATPLWCDDPSAVFGGNDWGGGTCRFARPVLLVDGYPPFFSAPLCYHDPGEAEYEWSVLPAICESTLEPASSGYVDFDETDGTFWLDLRYASPGPENNREGTFRLEGGSPFFGENVLFGDLSATLAGHVCVAGLHSACRACGAHHGNDPDFRCFHLDWCASKTSATADCNCAEPFVRIGRTNAWRLVGPDLCCCTAWASSGSAEIASAPAGLGATIEENIFLCVSPSNRSPTIGGFVANYRVLGPTGGLVRTLSLPFTCADMGIEPDFGSTWIPDGATPVEYFISSNTLHVASRSTPYPIRLWNESPSDARLVFAFDAPTNGPSLFDSSLVTRHSSLVTTNTAPFAALNDDTTVYLDASCSNALATLSLTLSDPATNRTFLSESLSVKVVDTTIGEHWRVRSASDTLSWDFTDAPEDVYVYLWRPNADSIFGELITNTQSRTPSLSLDLPPGDYLLDAYFPRVYDGVSSAAWSTNYLHVVHTEVTPSSSLRFTNAVERACFALTNNNGQAANWTISPVVAGGPTLFSSKTGGAGSAARLDNATSVWVRAGTMPGNYTITATHPHCPASTTNATFTVGRIDVESLLFNWDTTSSTNDAINLRWNYKDEINLATGEWTRAGSRAPACYVTNARPIVRATFSAAPADLPSVTLLAETDAAIGGFAATNVAFAGGAASDVALSTKSATTNCILKESFELVWKAVVSNETEVVTNTLGKTDGHVLYTILGEPVSPWTNDNLSNTNVWVSALEFVTTTNVCHGTTNETTALTALTQTLFNGCQFTYDTSNGMPHNLDFSDNWFLLSNYVAACKSSSTKDVNCFDQAHGLTYLAASLGIATDILRMDPFGYLNPGYLIGVTNLCNNPFYAAPWTSDHAVLCGTNDTARSKFSCHFFVRHGTQIFDACAGPAIGTEDIAEYISRMVDTSTHDERFYLVRKRDIFGVWHLLTVEGGVPTNAVPYTETDGIR